MTSTERITRRKLSDDVFDRLKELILRGDLSAGEALPSERELMERFGVGRPAIREALQALANLGLIGISHGERARITKLTPDALFRQIDLPARLLLSGSAQSLQHLLEARMFFERSMARAAAERATPFDIEGLETVIERQRASFDMRDAFIGHDMNFHVAVAEIVGNPIFCSISRSMLGWLRQYRTEMLHWSGKESLTIVEHVEITACIAAHDPAGAEAAMVRHIERSNTLYVHHAEKAEPGYTADGGRVAPQIWDASGNA